MKKFCFLLLVLFLMLAVVSVQADNASILVTGTYHQTSAREVLQLVNDFRTGGDAWCWNKEDTEKVPVGVLPPLVYDYGLEKVAMQRAIEAAISFHPSHHRPDDSECFTAWDLSEGVYSYYGENVAGGSSTPLGAFTQWKEEEQPYAGQGHRRNMLDASFNCIGIAHVVYNGWHYWVQELGQSSAPITAETPALEEARQMTVSINPDLSANAGGIVLVTADNPTMPVFSEAPLPAVSFFMKYTWPGDGASLITVEGLDSSVWTSVSEPSKISLEGNRLKALGAGNIILEGKVLGQDVKSIVEITPEDLSTASVVISEPDKLVFSGLPLEPAVTVTTAGGTVLTRDVDYSVFYADNTFATGSPSLLVTGQGNYTGSVTVPFSILPAPITAAVFDELAPAVYTGKPLSGSVCVRFGEQQLTEGMEYTVEWSDCINAGTATATVTGIGNFTGETTLPMEILPREIHECTVEIPADQFDPGPGFVPQVTVKYDDILLKTDTDYTIRADIAEKSIEGKVILTGIGNLCGERTEDISVTLDFKAGGLCYTRTGSNAVFTGPSKKTVSALVIPDAVSFAGKTYRVTQIGISACKGLKKLSKVTIGSNVSAVGVSAFASCPKLSTVKFGSKVATIGGSAFENCSVLKSVTLPNSVKSIGNNAFAGCKKLSSLKLSTRLHTIGDSAFLGDTALKAVTLPSAVKKIGKKAFANCKNLKKIIIQTKKLTKSTVGASAFKGIYAKAVVTCPKNKVKAYAALLRTRGMGSKVTFR